MSGSVFDNKPHGPKLTVFMLVAQIQENFELGLSQMPIPALPPKGALVRVIGCGLCGSDLDKYVHQKASPGSVLGHEVVGIIEALDDEHPSGWHLGDRLVTAHHVPCRHCHYCQNDSESMCRQFKSTNLTPGGFSQYIALTEEHLAHTAHRVPANISSAEASCVEPLACVLRAVRRSMATSGGSLVNGSVAVVGLGFIGMMAAQAYQNDGLAVYGLDLDRERLALAQQQGFVMGAFHPEEEREQFQDTLTQQVPLGKVDVAFLTTINRKTVALALELVRDGGGLVVFTSAATGTSLDPGRLYFRELNVITSYSPSLSDLKDAARMIFERKINVQPLISHQMPISEIRQAFELYRGGQAMKVFISMGDSE
ncbi:MAG TPA: alcohol dehydrogenase catalytic domain-containing protein [Coleofasciculaceae cyanobacterium]|jgi:L-iditol 2-dehydrogenase